MAGRAAMTRLAALLLLALVPAAQVRAEAEDGREPFRRNCAPCHYAGGTGTFMRSRIALSGLDGYAQAFRDHAAG